MLQSILDVILWPHSSVKRPVVKAHVLYFEEFEATQALGVVTLTRIVYSTNTHSQSNRLWVQAIGCIRKFERWIVEWNQCGEKLALIRHKHVKCILCMELVFAPPCLRGAVHMKYPLFCYPIPAYKDLIGFSASREQSNQMCVYLYSTEEIPFLPVIAKWGDQIEELCRGDVT